MKKTAVCLFCVLGILCNAANAQVTPNGLVSSGVGTVLGYTASDNGQVINFPVKIISRAGGGITFEYTVTHGGDSFSGQMIVSKEGYEEGKNINSRDLNPGERRVLTPDQTIFFFSKQFFNQLLKMKSATYNGTVYNLGKIPQGMNIVIGGIRINALYIYSEKEKTAYWILNDPEFPLILKSSGSKNGPDFTLATVKMG